MFHDKYKSFRDMSFIENTKIDLFCLYYIKYHYNLRNVYNYYFEEDYYNGPTMFCLHENNYNYLLNTIDNIYQFYK